jgi:hypothetical protein
MTPLMTALLGTAALLVGLCLVIQGGWWLVLRLFDPLLERSRLDVQQERILRHHELLERHRQERAQQLALQRIRVRAVPGAWCASTGGAAACAGIPPGAVRRGGDAPDLMG